MFKNRCLISWLNFKKKKSMLLEATKKDKARVKNMLLHMYYKILAPAIKSKNLSTIRHIKDYYGENLNMND